MYGQGTGPVLAAQVQCVGNETSIFDCPQNGIGMQTCGHSQDAGVTCTPRMCSLSNCIHRDDT